MIGRLFDCKIHSRLVTGPDTWELASETNLKTDHEPEYVPRISPFFVVTWISSGAPVHVNVFRLTRARKCLTANLQSQAFHITRHFLECV